MMWCERTGRHQDSFDNQHSLDNQDFIVAPAQCMLEHYSVVLFTTGAPSFQVWASALAELSDFCFFVPSDMQPT